MGWIRARLGGVGRLEVLGQILDLRQVFQLEWVIVGGQRDLFILNLVCSSWGIQRLGHLKFLWCIFPRRVP